MASTFTSALTKARKKRPAKFAPSLPPLGSFDPGVLLQYGANRRGAEDAQAQFDLAQAQAQDDFAIGTGRLGQRRTELEQDHTTALSDLHRDYGNLAARQNEGALKANVQSAGLLKQALAARLANQQHDQTGLDTSFNRAVTTNDEQKADLGLNLSRLFGSGRNGNPLGSNTLNLIQTKNNATAGNLDLSQVAYQQAAAAGYRIPRRKTRRQPMVI